MRALSEGFLPNTRSHVLVIGKMDRKGYMCVCAQLAIRIKRKRKRKEEFGVSLGKLSGRKIYRKVFGVRLGVVPVFARIGVCKFGS